MPADADHEDEAERRRLYHLATMAGSVAPRGSYGLPSDAQRAASRKAWRDASTTAKALSIAYALCCVGGLTAMLVFVGLREGLGVVLSAAFVVVVLPVGLAVEAMRATRRRRSEEDPEP